MIDAYIRHDALEGRREIIFVSSTVTEDEAQSVESLLKERGFGVTVRPSGFWKGAIFYIYW